MSIDEVLRQPATVLIDVRNPWEFESGHIEGARNIPLNEIPSQIAALKSMNKPIIMYCQSGGRSAMATSILQQHGIGQVYNGGGIHEIFSRIKR